MRHRVVVMLGVAAAVDGYDAGGLLGAAIGLVVGLAGIAGAMVRGRSWGLRGHRIDDRGLRRRCGAALRGRPAASL